MVMTKRIKCDCGEFVYSLYTRKLKKWRTLDNFYYCENCNKVIKLND